MFQLARSFNELSHFSILLNILESSRILSGGYWDKGEEKDKRENWEKAGDRKKSRVSRKAGIEQHHISIPLRGLKRVPSVGLLWLSWKLPYVPSAKRFQP